MASAGGKENEHSRETVSAYKAMLRDLLDSRPSGTRQRLADAIGKNRSFITQITNPAYSVPVPAQHVPVILDICHITGLEREQFLEAYYLAHPRRPHLVEGSRKSRHITLDVPDLGSAARNQKFDSALRALVQSMSSMADDPADKA